jgi:hypothetical protein
MGGCHHMRNCIKGAALGKFRTTGLYQLDKNRSICPMIVLWWKNGTSPVGVRWQKVTATLVTLSHRATNASRPAVTPRNLGTSQCLSYVTRGKERFRANPVPALRSLPLLASASLENCVAEVHIHRQQVGETRTGAFLEWPSALRRHK